MKILEVVISVFTNISGLDNSPKTIKKLLDVFENEEVLFNSIQLVNVSGSKSSVSNRPQIVSQTKKWRIDFLPNRIDWVINFDKDGTYNDSDIYGKVMYVTNQFKLLFDKLNFKASRLAYNTNYIYEQLDLVRVNDFIIDFNTSKHDKLYEWKTQRKYHSKMDLMGHSESINIVEEFDRVNNNKVRLDDQLVNVNALTIHYDINTSQDNSNERLTKESFSEFISQSYTREKEKRQIIEGVLK